MIFYKIDLILFQTTSDSLAFFDIFFSKVVLWPSEIWSQVCDAPLAFLPNSYSTLLFCFCLTRQFSFILFQPFFPPKFLLRIALVKG